MAPYQHVVFLGPVRDQHPSGETVESHSPLITPDLDIDVDDVVVDGDQASHLVDQLEGALLVATVVVPDNSNKVTVLLHSVRPRR